MNFRRSILVFLATVLMTAPVFAQQTRAAHNPKPQIGHLGRCLVILDLDEAQKASVQEAIQTAAPELRAITEQIRSDQQALRAELQSDSPDACTAGESLLAVRGGELALHDELGALGDAIRSFLTSEQQSKLEGCMQALSQPNPGDQPPAQD